MHDQVKRSRLKAKLFLVVLLAVAGCIAVVLYQRVEYPYGHRAAVLRSMYFALLNYASDHGGSFPSSEKGNYDALQKLFPDYTPSGIELAGISGNADAAVAALRNNTPLDQSLTSWVYVQGLKEEDDPNLAVLWELRSGLYPNGKRNSFGGHAVLLVSGDITNVPATDWEGFVKQQEQLRRKQAAGTNTSPGAAR